MPTVIVDNINIILGDLTKKYQDNFQSNLIICQCGVANAVSICSNFKMPKYISFCIGIVDYNIKEILTKDQLKDLKLRAKLLLNQNINIFRINYAICEIICFKGTNHFISYVNNSQFEYKNLKSNSSYLYDDINNALINSVDNINIKNLPIEEAIIN